MYDVIVLKEGYTHPEASGAVRSCGTVTLLKSPSNNILVDTGNPWDKDTILKGLSVQSLTPEDIQYVVGTHGHSDHIGNLNLFTQATHIVGFDICRKDHYINHDFRKGIPYEIDEDVEIWPTPGHTCSDVSVLVRNTNLGTVAVAGDLFECEADLECPSLWQDNSSDPYLQEKCRLNILKVADYIVPGHGPIFEVPKEYKRQLRVVMLCEEYSFSENAVTSKSECIIVETD